MKTAILAFTMVGALAGTTLNTVAQDPNDDQVIQELRDERATLAAQLADLEAALDATLQERMRGEDQLHSLEAELAEVLANREAIEVEIAVLREHLERSMIEREQSARDAAEMQREVQAQIADMEREMAQREMRMDRERAELEMDQARRELDMERALMERRVHELEAVAIHARSAGATTPATSSAPADASTGITIIMNGGDLHIHGSTDHVTVQPSGSR